MKQQALKARAIEQCNVTCTQHFEYCKQHCVDNCSTCSAQSQITAAKNFEKYAYEREVEGKKVMRELNSYRDPLQCRKVTCDCLVDVAICKQGCTGVIKKRLQIVPYCV
jgi:site-specific recombinase XerD